MVKHYKQVNDSGELVLLLTYDFQPKITNPSLIEITEDEYNALSAEIASKAEAETVQTDQEALIEMGEKAQAYDIILGVSK